jgi:hypothetical protein
MILYINNKVYTFVDLFIYIISIFVLALEYDAIESKQIRIISEPRSKFRPRTQNESKTSSHYLRCEENVKPEYPTITVCY